MTYRLHRTAIDWALAHLLKHGDTDALPVPFEYQAIAAQWPHLAPQLLLRDIAQPTSAANVPFLLPKPEGAFRVITRLDPIEAVLYTGALFECAPLIETARVSNQTACAFRVAITPTGDFFSNENGWDAFTFRSREWVNVKDTTHVVLADISDFYSQVSHHVLGNLAGVPAEKAQAIQSLLERWYPQQSRSLPVGPQASIVLAEALMTDVDLFLASRGHRHLRYVDDFRIFCTTHADAVRALYELSDFLYSSYRLALNPAKTRIHTKDVFVADVLNNPYLLDRRTKKDKISRLMNLWAEAKYDLDDALGQDAKLTVNTLVELFNDATRRGLKHSLARYLLRRAAALKTDCILAQVLESLPILVPVLRHAIKYLESVTRPDNSERVVEKVAEFCFLSEYAFLPLVQEWAVDALTGFLRRAAGVEMLSAASEALTTAEGTGQRAVAILARARGDVAWVRSQKERWQNAGPWPRRAIIWAGSILSPGERLAWKNSVLSSGDMLDRVVAATSL